MDKKHLGLGIVFSGIDKGLQSVLKGVGKGVGKTSDALNKLKQSADGAPTGGKGSKKGGPFAGMLEGAKLLSLSAIGSQIDELRRAISGEGLGVQQTFEVLDSLQARLSQALDPKMARQFTGTMMGVMRATGLTADQTQTLAQEMLEFGRSEKDVIRSLPMMGKLVGYLGMDAAHVARMFGQGLAALRATPDQMDALLKSTVKMQKAYKLTKLTEVLPDIFDTVTKNAAMFGKVNAKATIDTVQNTTKLVAVFQKLGKSQSQAVAGATGFVDKLADMKRSIVDIQVGLDPLDESIFDMQEAMTLAGFDANEAFQMIMEGADKPAELVQQIQKRMEGLSEGQQTAVTARLRRIFGDDLTNMIGAYRGEAEGAIKAAGKQEEKLGTASDEFKKLESAMAGTAGVQSRLTDSAKDFFELTAKFANKQEYLRVLHEQRSAWDAMTISISGSDSALKDVMLKLDMFKTMGFAGLISGTAKWGVYLEMVSGWLWPIIGALGLFHLLWKPVQLLGRAFLWIFKIGKPLVKVFGLIGRFAGIMWTAFQAIGAIIGVSAGIVAGVVIAVIAAIVLLIIYWDEVKKYTGQFFDWMAEMWTGASDWIVGTWDSLVGGITNAWTSLKQSVSKGLDRVTDSFKRAADKVGGFLGNLVVSAKKLISPIFEYLNGLVETVSGMFKGIWNKIAEVFSNPAVLFEGLKKAFSKVVDVMSAPFKMLGDVIQKALSIIPDVFSAIMEKVTRLMPDWLKTIIEKGGGALGAVASFAGSAGAKVGSYLGFGGTETQTAMGTVVNAPVVTMTQEGAPSKSSLGGSATAMSKPIVEDRNLQGVIDAVAQMNDNVTALLGELSKRPVQIILQGSAKKFFSAMSQEAAGVAGNLGLSGG